METTHGRGFQSMILARGIGLPQRTAAALDRGRGGWTATAGADASVAQAWGGLHAQPAALRPPGLESMLILPMRIIDDLR
jgi:hypothetical protein